jgi:hypothetical protein
MVSLLRRQLHLQQLQGDRQLASSRAFTAGDTSGPVDRNLTARGPLHDGDPAVRVFTDHAGAGVATGGLRRTISISSAVTSETDWAVRVLLRPLKRDMQNASFGRRHWISRAAVAIHLISNSYTTSRKTAVASSANCRRYMGERMAFPWELNLDRPYRDEKWPFPGQRARGESTGPVFGGSAEKVDGFPAETRDDVAAERRSYPISSMPTRKVPQPLAQPGVERASMSTALRS